jgi:DNA-binding beta-propeller fold protein YncE
MVPIRSVAPATVALLLSVALLLTVAGCKNGTAQQSPSPSVAEPKVKPIARITTGAKPCGVTIAAGYVWVSNFGDSTVVRIDPATNTLAGAPAKTGGSPCGMSYGGGSIWTSDYSGDSTTRIDARTGAVQGMIATGKQPYDASFAAGSAWITNFVSATVSKVDSSTGAVSNVKVGAGPSGLAAVNGQIWSADSLGGTITRIDAASGKVVGTVDIGGHPSWTSYDQAHVWVSDTQGSMVKVLDAKSGAVVATASMPGGRPTDGAVADGVAWIPDLALGYVYRVTADGSVTKFQTGLTGPFVLDVADGSVWVADWRGSDVIRFATANPLG